MSLHVSDRSRLVAGWARCPRLRYLTYHHNNTGYVTKERGIDLAFGTLIHDTLANVVTTAYEVKDDTKKIEYFKDFISSGATHFALLMSDEDPRHTREMVFLYRCLIWGFIRTQLPWIITKYDIVQVEKEEFIILGCTCGLGAVGSREVHDNRGCNGVAFLTRSDLILSDRSDGTEVNLDYKTAGSFGFSWEKKFEDSVQQTTQCLGYEQRTGRKIHSSYILGLLKGRAVLNEETGKKEIDSPFLKVYYRASLAPGMPDDIKLSAFYKDAEGNNRRATESKGYVWTSVWDTRFARQFDNDADLAENWVFWLDEEDVARQFKLVGPLPRMDDSILEGLKKSIFHHEDQIRNNLVVIKDNPEDIGLLDAYFPRTWECRKYGNDYLCAYYMVCKEKIGMDDTRYQIRIPHHEE